MDQAESVRRTNGSLIYWNLWKTEWTVPRPFEDRMDQSETFRWPSGPFWDLSMAKWTRLRLSKTEWKTQGIEWEAISFGLKKGRTFLDVRKWPVQKSAHQKQAMDHWGQCIFFDSSCKSHSISDLLSIFWNLYIAPCSASLIIDGTNKSPHWVMSLHIYAYTAEFVTFSAGSG